MEKRNIDFFFHYYSLAPSISEPLTQNIMQYAAIKSIHGVEIMK